MQRGSKVRIDERHRGDIPVKQLHSVSSLQNVSAQVKNSGLVRLLCIPHIQRGVERTELWLSTTGSGMMHLEYSEWAESDRRLQRHPHTHTKRDVNNQNTGVKTHVDSWP